MALHAGHGAAGYFVELTVFAGVTKAVAVWTRDIDRAHRVSNRLDAGTVWIATYGPTEARLPWGGMGGQSGIGRDLGRAALDNYTQPKVTWIARAG